MRPTKNEYGNEISGGGQEIKRTNMKKNQSESRSIKIDQSKSTDAKKHRNQSCNKDCLGCYDQGLLFPAFVN